MVRVFPELAIGRPARLALVPAFHSGKQCWGVESHEFDLRQLERAGCCDELDICNCACLEDVIRQVQMVECAYLQSHQDNKEKGKGRFGISEEAAHFARTHRKSGGHMVCATCWTS